MTPADLRQLLEAQAAAAQTQRGNELAKKRATIFIRLAATAHNVPHGRLSEFSELIRLAPIGFSRALDEIGTTFVPRHAVEFAAGVISRLQPPAQSSNLYAPKAYREIFHR